MKDTNAVIPMLAIRGAHKAIIFYKRAFQAEELTIMQSEDGTIQHAELAVNEAKIMIADEFPEHNQSPATLQGTSVILYVEVGDVDVFYQRSLEYGAETLRAPEAGFGEKKICKIKDPFGHVWMFSS
ncbi:VOC family protein [Aureibacillus halotolerans]|uniref:PhnB protein n=1 Tax=Aureibacillus halotolerans TaxID=1508390 RepID=A0A4R6U4R3_9BACI|nr:VOC family protein [Aureibacillus halotolerans]TDQ39783.1 PhnB protein [Aureibacillus halotolerans]